MSSPFNNRTPESYFAGLRRKDSKNALTTCHGVTDKGRACRRALASPKNSSRFDGAVVLTENVEDPAVFFCWQHKDQADTFNTGEEGSVVSLKGRHSLEDAFRSLGLDDVDEEQEPSSKEPSPAPLTPPHVDIPEPTRTVANDRQEYRERPSAYTYERHQRQFENHNTRPLPGAEKRRRRRRSERPSTPAQPRSSISLFTCCFGGEPSKKQSQYQSEKPERFDAPRPFQHRQRHAPHSALASQQPNVSSSRMPERVGERSPKTPNELRRKEVSSHRKTDSGFAMGSQDDALNKRSHNHDRNRLHAHAGSHSRLKVYRDASPTPAPRQSYQTHGDPKSDSLLSVPNDRPLKSRSKSTPDAQSFQRLHGEWPPPLPRNATDAMRLTYAKLLTAMSEPPSKTDSPGYIYIFWQTDVEQTEDETSAVATIISAPKLDRGVQRQETLLQRRFFQTSANAALPNTEKRTIFLKIGRAVNVHQRLHQWKKQCEYEISLLRSYPYDSRGSGLVTPVPNVVKVERLIHLHLEMLGQRVSKQCRCGTEHKEWFEVGASARDVREVDEIVRKWVRWSEDRFNES